MENATELEDLLNTVMTTFAPPTTAGNRFSFIMRFLEEYSSSILILSMAIGLSLFVCFLVVCISVCLSFRLSEVPNPYNSESAGRPVSISHANDAPHRIIYVFHTVLICFAPETISFHEIILTYVPDVF